MIYQIGRISVAQTSKVMAALYAVMGLIYVPFGLIIDAGAAPGQRLGLGIWLLMPAMFALFGFIFVAIGCAVYNAVAQWIGGIEVRLDETEPRRVPAGGADQAPV